MKFSALLVVAILAVTVSAAPHRHRKNGSHNNREDNYNREDNSNRENNSKHIDNSKTISQSNGGSSSPLIGLNLLGKESTSNSNVAYMG